MRWRTTGSGRRWWASRRIWPSPLSRAPSWRRCAGGSAAARERPPLRPDLVGAMPRGGARTRLVAGIGVAYVAAWVMGIGFGYGLKGTHWWDKGAPWEYTV